MSNYQSTTFTTIATSAICKREFGIAGFVYDSGRSVKSVIKNVHRKT